MISIKELSISYSGSQKVINSLSLNLDENKIHGVVGLNGAGKTTLLNALFGLCRYSEGEILYQDRRISKRDIAYLPTETFFYSNITAREYLEFIGDKSFDIDKWNKLFLLPLDKSIDSFSSGMKKKLAIMGVIKLDKTVLILDEPFNCLDIESCRVLRTIIMELRDRGRTVIVTSHIIESLTDLCDYIHHLDRGKIVNSVDKSGFKEFRESIFSSIEDSNAETIAELLNTRVKTSL